MFAYLGHRKRLSGMRERGNRNPKQFYRKANAIFYRSRQLHILQYMYNTERRSYQRNSLCPPHMPRQAPRRVRKQEEHTEQFLFHNEKGTLYGNRWHWKAAGCKVRPGRQFRSGGERIPQKKRKSSNKLLNQSILSLRRGEYRTEPRCAMASVVA